MSGMISTPICRPPICRGIAVPLQGFGGDRDNLLAEAIAHLLFGDIEVVVYLQAQPKPGRRIKTAG
jgi:hypothetical protein